jgi:iron-sulfur cluster repair protein YtfE (RIC family)
MANRQRFKEVKEKHMETLSMYVPIVARVHGGTHPEFHDVKAVFDALNEKIEKADSAETLKLDEEFEKLRGVTSNYTIPEDVCESYEAVYNMLKEMDEAYHN